jgi:exodeoxyribonuclease VII large subunit
MASTATPAGERRLPRFVLAAVTVRLGGSRFPLAALLLLFCGFLSFYGLNAGEFYRTESLRAIIAAEFLRTGNWLVPTLYGEPFLSKPPGMYIAITLASWPIGHIEEWSARLPSAIAATATVLLFYWYFSRQIGRGGGLVAAAVLPLSFLWLDKGTAAEIDMLQTFWVSAAILCFLQAVGPASRAGPFSGKTIPMRTSTCGAYPGAIEPAQGRPRTAVVWWWALALACVAGGVLTKWTAPAFFYGTAIPLLLWRRQMRLLWSRGHLIGLVLAAVICCAWIAAVTAHGGGEVLYATVKREALVHLSPSHFHRAYPWSETLAHPFRIWAASLPVSLFALPALAPAFARRWDDRGRQLLQSLHCWTWPNLVFWSLVPEHAVRQCFPLFPGIAGLAAMVWVAWLSCRLSWPVRYLTPLKALIGLLALWLVAKVVFVNAIVPARNQGREPRNKGEQIAALVPSGETLYVSRLKDEGIMFYYGRHVRRVASWRQLPSSAGPVYCILDAAEWQAEQESGLSQKLLDLQDEQGAPIVLVKRRQESFMNPPFVPAGVKILSVAELTRQVKGLMEEAFPTVWVAGEISNVTKPSSGHLYLTLKDNDAQLRAVMWRSSNLRLRFEPRDGLQVIACGRLSVYPARGEYQLVVEELHPKGLGALELALRQLREKLLRLGYFAPERKRALPRFPHRVVLVTSPSGAAVRDMLEILGRRWPAVEVWICPVRVQGDGAAGQIAAALHLANRIGEVDVIVVGRGGGSAEDLSAFNEECIAHAIFHSRIPVVSAVGHEIDLTIADLVADCRALTPSEAAELVTPHRDELLEGLTTTESRLRALLLGRLDSARRRLQDIAQCRVFRMPLERVREHERRLDEWGGRLERGVRQHVLRARERLESHAARLESLSPLNVLSRGYSLTRREVDQAVVRDSQQVHLGDRLITDVQHGRIFSRVEEANDTSPTRQRGL